MRLTVPEFTTEQDVEGRLQIDSTKPDRNIVIMAGIHQYGTLIVAEFFRRVAVGYEPFTKYSPIFLENNDFAAVIEGEFDGDNFEIRRCDVHLGDLWEYADGKWLRREGRSLVT